jgi:hypothetical protein
MDTDWQRMAEQPRLTPARETLKSSNPTHAPAPSYFSFSASAPVVSALQLPFLGSTNGTRFSQAPNCGSCLRIY